MTNVPSWIYKELATGNITVGEVRELEKFASSLNKSAQTSIGQAGAAAVISDPSNNLPAVLKAVPPEDRANVLAALRQLEKRAAALPQEFANKQMTRDRLKRMSNNKAVMHKKADFAQNAALMAGAALAPVVGHLAMRGIEALTNKSEAQIQKDLMRILQVHPDIGKITDPRVQLAYKTLVKLNPSYAEDPLIAGPLLKQIVENRLNPMNPQSGSYIDPGVAIKLTDSNKGNVNQLAREMGSSLSGAVKNLEF